MTDLELMLIRLAMIAVTVLNVIGFCQSLENLKVSRELQDEARQKLKKMQELADAVQRHAEGIRID
jgi:hypothetical protein